MDRDEQSDDALMALVAEGDRDAFVALVKRYQRHLLNFFARLGAHLDEADDLAQETFLRLFAYRAKYRPSARFRGFLFVLARHAWADMLLKSRRSTEVGSDGVEDAPDAAPSPACSAQTKLDVRAALAGLSQKLRLVVVLAVYEGMEYQEISDVLGIPVGTVKSRMHLAMRQLRETLDVTER